MAGTASDSHGRMTGALPGVGYPARQGWHAVAFASSRQASHRDVARQGKDARLLLMAGSLITRDGQAVMTRRPF